MRNNRQYDEMRAAAITRLKQKNPETIAAACGFEWDGTSFHVKSLGEKITISWPDCALTPELEMWHSLCILQVMALEERLKESGRFISMAEFKEGGMVRGTSFDKENEKSFEVIGSLEADNLCSVFVKRGGLRQEGKADLSYKFYFLPGVPLLINFWLADEEFPATGKVLFDFSVEEFLPVETAGTIAGILLGKIKADKKY